MTPDQEAAELTRRDLLIRGAGLAGAAGAASLLGGSAIARAATNLATPTLPPPGQSGINHVVVVMMENRSFDHMLGWLPNADGTQAGLSFVDEFGVRRPTARLAGFQGCGHPDPDHSYEGGRVQYNNGACDGFLLGRNDQYAIGYYTDDDLPFYGNAAPYWTTCDRYFAAIMAATYPNRFYMHSAQTDRLHNGDLGGTTLPTIWDRLAAKGVSHKYYYSDVPFIALWGSTYTDIAHRYDEFLADCESGDLPSVSFLDPRFINEGAGTAGDDHPHSDIRVGQAFLNQVYEAITNSPAWKHTVFVITYDEWGGFFDHVPPGLARDANPAARLRGFRVPAIVISPYAKRYHVAHRTYDHTSILKMIEWRWRLQPLTLRDAHARNIAEVLDFTHPPDKHAPRWDVPSRIGLPCPTTDPSEFIDWTNIRDKAVRAGFRLP
ncbi:MAG: phospholipase [Actinomycetota bacterium]|nr:phospholipase [Actinomycetota bacterium]